MGLVACGFLVACEDDPSTPIHEHEVASVQVQPTTLTLATGASSSLGAVARCGCGAAVDEAFTWTSSDADVASVASDGTVEARSFGTATIRATAAGFDATSVVTVLPKGTVVGPAGGTVTSADGGLVLMIPAGALTQDVDVVVEALGDGFPIFERFFVSGTAYQIIAEGAQLQVPARLRIRYDPDRVPEGIDPDRLRLRRLLGMAGWGETQQHQHHVQTREVEGWIDGFGIFALFGVAEGQWVGPPGATLVSPDGLLELEIPAGALDGWTDVTLAAADAAAFAGDARYVPGTAWSLGPDGLQLQERARLRIHYDPDQVPTVLDPARLRIRERDRIGQQWNDTHDNQAHQAQHRVEARIERFGLFAIVGEPVGSLIGPEGGLVAVGDGALELVVPAGALEAVVDIVATPLDDAPFVGDPLFVPGTAWELGPSGLQFQREVTLRLRYDPAKLPVGVDPQRLRLRSRDHDQQQWRETQRNRLRLQEHAVEGEVGHFSTFALVAVPQGQGPVASVTVSPASVQVETGAVVQMSAEVRDIYGNLIPRSVSWSSSDTQVASVDATGLVTGITEGDVVITASADGVHGQGAVQVKKGKAPVASVTVVPATLGLAIGQTGVLTAELRDALGTLLLDRHVSWSSANRGIATVDNSGVVTAVATGTTTVTAQSEGVSGTATVVVAPPIGRLEITDPGHEPLEIGFTMQLDATAYDQAGNVIVLPLVWSSSDESLATVDQTGLVTGTGRGVVTISVSAAGLTDSVDIRVVGEGGAYGNNLSWPVVFADGVGITGSPVATDPGIRPTAAENVTVTGLPFFWDQNVPDYGDSFYEQQSFNTWVAEWIDGSQGPAIDTEISWGDNLTHQTWSAARPIRVEQVLSATALTLVGFNMTYLYGQGPNEMQGTDGTTADFVPTVYTVGPTLTVERIAGPGGAVLGTVIATAVGSEVNVGGKIIYGYNLWLSNWTPPAGVTLDGWYRITFAVAAGGNVALTSVGNVGDELVYVPVVDVARNLSFIEILVNP